MTYDADEPISIQDENILTRFLKYRINETTFFLPASTRIVSTRTCTAGYTFCFVVGVGVVGATFNQTWQYFS
jgi:hypothetical protein